MAVAEVFLAAFITVLFERLASAGLWELARCEGITSQLEKSKKYLLILRKVLADASQKQIKDEAVRDWLNDLQALTYDLDDIVDDLLYETTDRKFKAESQASSSSSAANRLFQEAKEALSSVPFSRNIKSRLEKVTERLEDLTDRKNALGLTDNVQSSSNRIAERRTTTSLLDESSRIQGRDSDKEAVLRLVLGDETSDDGSVRIIPIVGMGGVGKTTLAQLVYNEDKVKHHFDLRAWVCVSEEFDVLAISKILYQSVTGDSRHFEDLNLLQVALKERISKMKFLIVLDDVWNQNREKWELLHRSFQVGLPGSKLIVTTRNDGVVSTMRCGAAYHLKVLTEEASISLFAQNSLGAQNFEAHPDFRLIGECIVRKCAGLPLALKTLGSLLDKTKSVEEWEELQNSEIWNLSEDDSSILPALRLSYHHLPPHLKQLFAYCSLFPKDYSFGMDELVLLWMGEGFLPKAYSRQQTEDSGQKYFKELLSRSFFQHTGDGNSRYVMHDLMNDLAQFVAGEFFFRLDDAKGNDREHTIGVRCHHTSFIRHEYEVFGNFKDFHVAKGLRTFLPLPVQTLEGGLYSFYMSNKVLVDLIPKLQCLRTLSLSGYSFRELPDYISRMRHLRYLNLSQTEIECLPEWVSHLYNLQTLLLFGCKELARLPTTFMHLTGLRHFNIADTPKLTEMPLGIGTLTSLQTLSKMLLTEGSGSRLKELKDLSDLRGVLSIIGLHNVMNVHDAKTAKLISKQGLDDLEMEWSDNFDGSRDEALEKEVLDALKPSSNLRRVKIKCYGGVEFPSWIGNPSFCHTGEVTLAGCRKCTFMSSLGQLPHLKKLFIRSAEGVKVVGSEFYNAGNGRVPVAFPSLEILRFEDMANWEEWSTENVDDDVSVFPCLWELEMLGCPKLEKVSPGKLPSLQLLEMGGCGEVALRSMLGLASEITTLKVENIAGLTGLHEGVLDRFIGVEIVDLKVSGCEELKYLWKRGSESYVNLKLLRVESCSQLVSLVEGEGEEEGVLPHNLEELTLRYCRNLEKLPHNWRNNLKCLKSLTIWFCPKLQYSWGKQNFVKRNGGGFKINQSSSSSSSSNIMEEEEGFCQLERMDIRNCSSLRWLPTGGQKKQLPTTLEHLRIWDCSQLEEPEEKNWLLNSKSSLESIYIRNWVNLKSFTSSSTPTRELGGPRGGGGGLIGFQHFINLTSLRISGCPGLESFPERGGGGGLPPCLRRLVISECENLKWLLPNSNYEGWDQCDSLTELGIFDCPRLVEGFPCGVWPPNLQRLTLGGELGGKPANITQGEWGLHNAPPTLVYLTLRGSKVQEVISFSTTTTITGDQSLFLLPPSITRLYLSGMSKLETLSMGLQNLTSLQHLKIVDCPKLRSLPKTLLPSLSSLKISGDCPIKEREKGDYWPLLSSHIPCVRIDGHELRGI